MVDWKEGARRYLISSSADGIPCILVYFIHLSHIPRFAPADTMSDPTDLDFSLDWIVCFHPRQWWPLPMSTGIWPESLGTWPNWVMCTLTWHDYWLLQQTQEERIFLVLSWFNGNWVWDLMGQNQRWMSLLCSRWGLEYNKQSKVVISWLGARWWTERRSFTTTSTPQQQM